MNRVEIKLLERGAISRRRALNSPLAQGAAEIVQYFADFTPWGASDSYPVSAEILTVLNEDLTHGGIIATVVIADGGTGYSVDDVLVITDSGSSGDGTAIVTAETGGVIDTVELGEPGFDYTAGVKATVQGNDDATVTITVSADDKIVVRNSISIVSNVEVQFTLNNFVVDDRYRVFIKGTINSLVGECWTYIDGKL